MDITDQTTKDPSTRIQKNHPTENIIGDLNERMRTRDKPKRNYHDMVRFVCYTSSIEPKNVKKHYLMNIGLMLCKRNWNNLKEMMFGP